jgi:hypothetical protein
MNGAMAKYGSVGVRGPPTLALAGHEYANPSMAVFSWPDLATPKTL